MIMRRSDGLLWGVFLPRFRTYLEEGIAAKQSKNDLPNKLKPQEHLYVNSLLLEQHLSH